MEPGNPCEPTTKHIRSYLNEKFLAIITKFFRRVSADSDYFYFCSDEERFRQSRSPLEIDDRLANNHLPTNNLDMPSTTSGPYKFDETNGHDHDSETEDDRTSTGTVHIHDHHDDDDDHDLRPSRRRSDGSSNSLSNPLRDAGIRDLSPLFICFNCRSVAKDYDQYTQVETIPLCIGKSKGIVYSRKCRSAFPLSESHSSLDGNEDRFRDITCVIRLDLFNFWT